MSVVGIKQVITKAFSKDSDDSDTSTTPFLSPPNNNSSININNNTHYNSIDNLSPDLEDQLSDSLKNGSSNLEQQSNSGSSVWVLNKIDPRIMSDIIIGLSDGLTVPFALTAGLSSLGDTRLVITGGFAELISGAISMGLGGYLAAKSESEYYKTQVKQEKQNFFNNVDNLEMEIEDTLIDIGLSNDTISYFIKDLEKQPNKMIDFIIKYGKGLEEPAENRQVTSALTIGSGYFFGGFIPLIPYFFTETVATGLLISIIIMFITLFWFGYFKTMVTLGENCSLWEKVSEGFQMVLIGSLAAGCAWLMVFLIDSR